MTEIRDAGTYTLTMDRYTNSRGESYEKGDKIELSEAEATRLVNAGAVADPESFDARLAAAGEEERRRMIVERYKASLDAWASGVVDPDELERLGRTLTGEASVLRGGRFRQTA